MQHYIKRKELTGAETLSRASNKQPTTMDKLAEKVGMIQVNLITNNIPASTDGLEEIRIYTQQDKTLQIMLEDLCNGWPT